MFLDKVCLWKGVGLGIEGCTSKIKQLSLKASHVAVDAGVAKSSDTQKNLDIDPLGLKPRSGALDVGAKPKDLIATFHEKVIKETLNFTEEVIDGKLATYKALNENPALTTKDVLSLQQGLADEIFQAIKDKKIIISPQNKAILESFKQFNESGISLQMFLQVLGKEFKPLMDKILETSAHLEEDVGSELENLKQQLKTSRPGSESFQKLSEEIQSLEKELSRATNCMVLLTHFAIP